MNIENSFAVVFHLHVSVSVACIFMCATLRDKLPNNKLGYCLALLKGIMVHFRVLTLKKTLTLLIDAASFIDDLQSSFGRRLQKEAASEEISEWQISR